MRRALNEVSQCEAFSPPTGLLEPFVDAERAAAFLSLRRRRVLELARQGQIPAHPLGQGKRREWRFRLSELAATVGSRLNCAHAAVRAERKETF
jgi:hypothetical protein